MNTNEKGRHGWHREALRAESNCAHNLTGLAAGLKGIVVALALCGLLPYGLEDWLIRIGGMRNV